MSTSVGSIHYDLDLKKDKFDANSKSASTSIASLGKKFAKFSAVTVATATATGFAIKKTLIDPAIDLNESMNAVQKTFGDASKKIFEFGKTADKTAGMSRSAFHEATVPIGAMLQNMGLEAEKVADETINLAQRASDLSSVFNKDLSVSLTALQSGLRGESEPLKQFGVDLSQTAVQAYALRTGIIKQGEALTGTALATARLGAFYEQTTKFAGDFVDTSDQSANKTRIQQARFENLRAEIGNKLLPVYDKLLEYAEKFIGTLEQNTDKVDDFLNVMGRGLGGVKSILSVLWQLHDVFIALGVVFGVHLIITKVATAVTALGTAFNKLIMLLATNPVAVAITAIATAFVLLNRMIDSNVEAMERAYREQEATANQMAENAHNEYQQAYDAWARINDITSTYISTLKQLRNVEERVAQAQEELNKVINKYGAESQEAKDATAELSEAQAELKQVELQRKNGLIELTDEVNNMFDSTGALKNITEEETDVTIANIKAMRDSMVARGEDTSSIDELYQAVLDIRRVKDTYITTNTNTGEARRQLDDIRRRIINIPTSRHTHVSANVHSAYGAIAGMKNLLDSIPRSVNILLRGGTTTNFGPYAGAYRFGSAEGGFTGRGQKYDVAGVVHRGEYVIPKEHVNQYTGLPKAMGNSTVFNGNINIGSQGDALDIMQILTRNQNLAVEGL